MKIYLTPKALVEDTGHRFALKTPDGWLPKPDHRGATHRFVCTVVDGRCERDPVVLVLAK